jgi:hypothetical protein
MRLKGNPTMEGMIDVRWTIDPKGVVADVSVDESKSDIADASVTRCLGNVLRRIKFAESPKGLETKAHYPFHFNPRSGGRVAGQDGGT